MDRKESILIIDEDENTRRSLSYIFAEKGYETDMAWTGQEALKKAEGRFFNVALLETNLPDMEGLELLPRLKKMHPDMMEILVSGHDSHEAIRDGPPETPSAYITKPLNMDEVLDTVRHVLEKQRLMIEKRLTNEALQRAHDEFERRITERTAELVSTNERLQREIKELKRLAKALSQKEKLRTLGAIAAEVAHEIRNPLVSIGGFARRLQRKVPDLPECDIILSESQRLERILSRISDYLKPVEMRPQECSINNTIKKCVNLLSSEIKQGRVRFRLDLATDLSRLFLDPNILSQVFINLIRNTVRDIDKGGALIINTFESEQDIYVEFKNQAPRTKLKDPEALFMPFSEGGHSIGLPFCHRIIKDMGGLLFFAQDRGLMTFTVSLPKTLQPA